MYVEAAGTGLNRWVYFV